MPSTLVDSGPLVAFIDRSDRHHEAARTWITQTGDQLITNIAVLTEVTHLLDFSVDAQLDFLQWAGVAMTIDGRTGEDVPRIAEIMTKYRDQPVDFADASLVALAERQRIGKIASLDKDFDIYRTRKGRALRNVLKTK